MLVKIETKKPTGFENVIRTVNIREPLAGDLVGLDFMGDKLIESTQKLAERLTNLTEDEIRSLPFKEWNKIQTVISEYMTP